MIASEGYGNLLRELAPGAVFDVAYPADTGANLPDACGLEGYDGVTITGSALHIYQDLPEVRRQIELARAVYVTNDERAAIKKRINTKLGSKLVEEKSYASYRR